MRPLPDERTGLESLPPNRQPLWLQRLVPSIA